MPLAQVHHGLVARVVHGHLVIADPIEIRILGGQSRKEPVSGMATTALRAIPVPVRPIHESMTRPPAKARSIPALRRVSKLMINPASKAAASANQTTGDIPDPLTSTNSQIPTRLPATFTEYAQMRPGMILEQPAQQPAQRNEHIPDQDHEDQR